MGSPAVMAIINATPDSFNTSCPTAADAAQSALKAVEQGAAIIDVGGCSTRPGGEAVSETEELTRIDEALSAIRAALPDAPLSIDTFRADVARKAVEQYGANIINDISGGTEEMFSTVADLGVAYVLTHNDGGQYSASTTRNGGQNHKNPAADNGFADEADYMASVLRFLEPRVARLRELGAADVIVDPGFGFGKTLEQYYCLLRNLDLLHTLDCPVLAGLSHKSMLTQPLGISTAEAANATTVANTIALMNHADILRVHDTRNAIEAIKIHQCCNQRNA